MNWINVADKVPSKNGKYVVRTLTSKGNYNIFETSYYADSQSFTCSNQIVTHWLEHDFDFKADLLQRQKNKKK